MTPQQAPLSKNRSKKLASRRVINVSGIQAIYLKKVAEKAGITVRALRTIPERDDEKDRYCPNRIDQQNTRRNHQPAVPMQQQHPSSTAKPRILANIRTKAMSALRSAFHGRQPQERKPTVHDLKCLPDYFDAIVKGSKPFEIRFNDRGYQVGDILNLREHIPGAGYTGFTHAVYVTYVTDFDQRPGYVVMGITKDQQHSKNELEAEAILRRLMPFVLEDYFPEFATAPYLRAVEAAIKFTGITKEG